MGTARVSTLSKASFSYLPPELCLKVYRYLFILDVALLKKPRPSFLDLGFDDPEPKSAIVARLDMIVPTFRNKSAASPQLLQACKLCQSEGIAVLYGENVLSFEV